MVGIATTRAKAAPRTLREAIAASGLTTEQLMAKVGCTRRSLSNWRTGQRPSDYYIGKLSQALNTELWPLFEQQTARETRTGVSSFGASLIRSVGHSAALDAQNILGGLAEMSSATDGFRPVRGRLSPTVQRFLSEQVRLLWDHFHLAADEDAVPALQAAVAGHAHTLRSLGDAALGDDDQRWLLMALCEVEILAGRLARDQLNYDAAIRHHKQALALGLESNVPEIVVASTMRLGETLTEAGLVYQALSYCTAGMQYAPRANARVHGELLGFTAEVVGTVGDLRESERLAQRAAELAVGAIALPTFGGINFSETAAAEYLAEDALRRGDLTTALAHLARASTLLALEFQGAQNMRWQAHLAIDEARIQSRAGDVEAACNAVRQADRLAKAIGSNITVRKVQEAMREVILLHPSSSACHMLREELIGQHGALLAMMP